jgi:diacylglycerol kinase
MNDKPSTTHWIRKFGNACRGIKRGVRGQSSFFAHFFVALCVVVAAAVLRMPLSSWCLLVLCVASVLVAEMFNSAFEKLARAITNEHDPEIRDALDIASGAVLLSSIGAATVGAMIFVPRIVAMFG